MKPIYLMITYWENHWDKIRTTNYSLNMLKEGLDINALVENAETLFIKLDKDTKHPERAWTGTVSNYHIEGNQVQFAVNIKEEISLSQIPDNYKKRTSGWYPLEKQPKSINEYAIYPPLIYLIQLEEDWQGFEYFTYLLLKLIGINNIFRFAPDRQKGKADGFFYVGNLAVIYDVTLDRKFMENKETQISNYVNQLNEVRFPIPDKKIDITISKFDKEVWLITKGTTRTIRQFGEIKVKEISINSLIRIYKERLEKDMLESNLAEELKKLT